MNRNTSLPLNLAKKVEKFFTLWEVKNKEERKIFTSIWYKIWLKEKYTTEGSGIKRKKLYEKVSKDFLVNFSIFSIGTVRIIFNSEEIGLPVLSNFEIYKKSDREEIVEISLFSIREAFRFFHITHLIVLKKIYKFLFLKKYNIAGIVAPSIKEYTFFKKMLQILFHKIGKEKVYEGSLTLPIYLDLQEAEIFAKKNNPQIYYFFVET